MFEPEGVAEQKNAWTFVGQRCVFYHLYIGERELESETYRGAGTIFQKKN
jgi:hypothetical protein